MRRSSCMAFVISTFVVSPHVDIRHSTFVIDREARIAPTGENWPAWRGPAGNGVSGETNLPLRWSQTDNVAWKLAMPAFSGSTPVIWGSRIFLNVADDLRSREAVTLHLWCVERDSGKVLWQRALGGGNHQQQ